MSALTYRDFCQRLTMEDILKAAGYRFNRRDGMRYPCYVAVDSLGQRIKGDKFIVSPDRQRCFQPPFQQTYNVISFIRSFPEKFPEYQMGMSNDRLVNLVCNRLLNSPVEMNQSGFKTIYDSKPFDLTKFNITTFDLDNWDKMRRFYPYFRARGIDMSTMRAFSSSFILTSKASSNGRGNVNLSFPLRKPSTEEGTRVLGLELRSRPNKEGKTKFKGLAQGSEATIGLWMANPDTELWKRDLQDRRSMKEKFSADFGAQQSTQETATNSNTASSQDGTLSYNSQKNTSDTNVTNDSNVETNANIDSDRNEIASNASSLDPTSTGPNAKPTQVYTLPALPQNGDIYWFESGYDAMAYYQLNRKKVDFKDAIFVSTSGNPSVKQFQAVMEQFPVSRHHLCFDNDMAGRMFTLNFLLQLKGDGYCTRMDKSKDLLVVYDAWKCEPIWHIPCSDFNLEQVCRILDIDPLSFTREVPASGYKDWNDELLGRVGKIDSPRLTMLQPVPQQLIPKEGKVEAEADTQEHTCLTELDDSDLELSTSHLLRPERLPGNRGYRLKF